MVKKEKKAAAVPVVAAPVEIVKEAKKTKPATPATANNEKPKKVVDDVKMSDVEDLSDNENGGEVSQTVKEKKENAKKMLKAVKAYNAKLKSSIERKDITRAVQALLTYQKKVKSEKAAGTKQLLENENQFIQVNFTLTQVPQRPTPRPLEIKVPHPF